MKAQYIFAVQFFVTTVCLAQGNSFDEILSKTEKASFIVRIYSQILSFSWPKGFTLGRRSENKGAFSQVLKVVGESDGEWKQKILITGMQDASIKEKEPVKLMSNLVKFSYKSGCPKHYSVTDVGEMKLTTGQSAFVFMVGCGITIPVENSEKDKIMAMVVVMKGSADVYSVSWVERSNTDEVPPLSWPVWRKRLDSLLPIQIN